MKCDLVQENDRVYIQVDWLGGTARIEVGTLEQYERLLDHIKAHTNWTWIERNNRKSRDITRQLGWIIFKHTLFKGGRVQKDKLIKWLSRDKNKDTVLATLVGKYI